MARIDRITSDYTMFLDGSTYYGLCNICGGGPTYSGATKSIQQQNVVDYLEGIGGGYIYLKGMTLDSSVTYDSTIFIVEDYQGIRKTYGNARGAGEPHQNSDYLVFKKGSVWMARNGATGMIDSENSNPVTVINYALAQVGGDLGDGQSPQYKVTIRGNV